MPQILNYMLNKRAATLLILMILLGAPGLFAQYSAKKTIDGKTTITQTTEYYIYDRSETTYTGFSFATRYTTSLSIKSGYELDMIYTTDLKAAVKTISFIAAVDSNIRISAALVDDGTQYIDKKTLTSYKFHVVITDSLIQFFNKYPVKRIILRDEHKQTLPVPEVTEPSFMAAQFASIQNTLKRKVIYKKPVKPKPATRTRSY
jgi:hypothetical protein